VTILSLLTLGRTQCSTFQFIEQPPQEFDCNPFDPLVAPTPVWRLTTSCTAERISGSQTFDVHWFHKNSTGEIRDLRRPEFWIPGETREEVRFGDHLVNDPFIPDMIGEYWCQVIVTDQTPNVLLGISNVFTIRDVASYGSTKRCTGRQIVTETKCADQAPLFESTTSSSTVSSVAVMSATPSSTFISSTVSSSFTSSSVILVSSTIKSSTALPFCPQNFKF
jgi:hypothetical protein